MLTLLPRPSFPWELGHHFDQYHLLFIPQSFSSWKWEDFLHADMLILWKITPIKGFFYTMCFYGMYLFKRSPCNFCDVSITEKNAVRFPRRKAHLVFFNWRHQFKITAALQKTTCLVASQFQVSGHVWKHSCGILPSSPK